MRENLNWAVLGTGVIANEMAAGVAENGKIPVCSWKPYSSEGNRFCRNMV